MLAFFINYKFKECDKMSKNIDQNKIDSNYLFNSFSSVNSTILFGLLPFVGLFLIGLIYGNITYHQKVFKTLLIFLVDCFLLISLFIRSFTSTQLKKDKRYLIYFLVYLIYVSLQFVVAFFANESPYDIHYHYSNYLLLISFATFVFLFVDDIETIKFSSILFSIFFIILFYWSIKEMLVLINTNKSLSAYRPSFSFGNTDYFSCYMIGLLPLAIILPFAFDKDGSIKNFIKHPFSIVSFILALLGLFPIFLSQTRAAWIGLFFAVALVGVPSLIIMQNRLKKIDKIIYIISFIIIMFAVPIGLLNSGIPLFKKLAPRIAESLSNPMFSIKDRINGWSGGIGLFKEHPVFGAGLGTVYAASFKYMSKYFYIYSPSNSFKHSHCEYIEVLGEGGIVGITLFLGLLFFILISLFRVVYSKKYRFDFRLISLGVALGLISMMIHQIFSLAFRMSVTMSAYFFIIGLGVLLISFSNKYMIADVESKSDNKKFLINKKELYILMGIILVLAVSSFFLFKPVFQAERHMVKGEFQKANEKMPTYIYSISHIYTTFINMGINKLIDEAGKDNFDDKYEENILKAFNTLNSIIDRLDSIIPNYQTIGEKYSDLYYREYIYFLARFNKTGNVKYYEKIIGLFPKMADSTGRSLNTNFLSFNDCGMRLFILRNLGDEAAFRSLLQDLITARIYFDICMKKRVVKENVNISFESGVDSQMSMKTIKNQHYYDFIINIDEELPDYENRSLMEITYSIIDNNISLYYKNLSNMVYELYSQKLYGK